MMDYLHTRMHVQFFIALATEKQTCFVYCYKRDLYLYILLARLTPISFLIVALYLF